MAVQDHDAYWHPGLETQSRADWRKLQPDLLKDHLRPPIAVPPFGDLVAVSEQENVYISASSGSAGVPTATPGALPRALHKVKRIDDRRQHVWS